MPPVIAEELDIRDDEIEPGATFQDAMNHFGFHIGYDKLYIFVVHLKKNDNGVSLRKLKFDPYHNAEMAVDIVNFRVSDEILAILPYIMRVEYDLFP